MRSLAEQRRRLVAGLAGHVLEVGAGVGSTFGQLPPAVTQLTVVEPHAGRRAAATGAARMTGLPAEVLDAVAEELPLGDDVADAAVVSLALCSVRDLDVALAELRRVLRAGGVLRFLEHVVPQRGWRRALVRAAAPVYARMPDSCRIDRDTVTAIAAAGFTVVRCERFLHADGPWEPALPHVLGEAVRAPINRATGRIATTPSALIRSSRVTPPRSS